MKEKIFREQLRQFTFFKERLKQSFFYDTVTLEAEYYHSVEPVKWQERLNLEPRKISVGDTYAKKWENAWFHIRGTIPARWIGKPVWVRLNLGGEILIFDDNGVPVFGLTNTSQFNQFYQKEFYRLIKCADENSKIDFWCEAAANGLFGEDEKDPVGICQCMSAGVVDEELQALYYDVKFLLSLFEFYKNPCARKKQIASALAKAEAIYADTPANAKAAREMLAPQLSLRATDSELTATTIGHAHIDVGWLWAVRESIRKSARTFSSQIVNIEEYPEYIFGASQPQLYAFVKEHYPELFAKIKEQVKAGRWECQGGMWVEADCNIISGESMIRQFLHGKNFFKDEFGVDVKNLWIPDVFGYSAAMPQIIKKCNCNYFLTQKISWSQFNKFPYNTFMWQGIDGSRVLTHFPPEDTYNSNILPGDLARARDNFGESDIIPEFMVLAGIGDGGGGPAMLHLENGRRCADIEGAPQVRYDTAANFFERIKEYAPQLPSWVGELYLELHRGTLTTQSRTKRGNRKCEQLLAATEFIYSCLPADKYPAKELDRMWKLLLCNQFHDIIPGSSVRQVYTVTEKDYEDILASCSSLIEKAGVLLPEKEDSLTLLNTLSYDVSQLIALPRSWHGYSVTDENGKELATQHDDSCSWCMVDIPACDSIIIKRGEKVNAAPSENNGALVLENELIRYEFDRNALLISAYDKELKKEFISGKANLLGVYVDNPVNWDAWDIDYTYMNASPAPAKGVSAVKSSDGKLRKSLDFVLTVGEKSTLKQQIVLTSNSKRLDFITQADWHETHKMLRTSFKTTVNASEATCDIQYGSIKRPTHTNTSWDFARFEVAAHRYVDITDANGGAALLNDCKYGYHLSADTLDLNLLRSPVFPDKEADQGAHTFTYSFLPHGEIPAGNSVMQESAMLNREPVILAGAGKINVPFRITEVRNVALGALKKAEKSDDIIIRLAETDGRNGSIKLAFSDKVSVKECDMLEWNDVADIADKCNEIELKFTAFEIKTLRVKKQ